MQSTHGDEIVDRRPRHIAAQQIAAGAVIFSDLGVAIVDEQRRRSAHRLRLAPADRINRD